ncbi:hypothetical protein KVR01_011960 [Diaporthe batatas]|uniref:uncharacterized protein n=1 Tax=Diaporthe batatas TaxID=748121 RepID=UPI001D03DA44|nr:uncharacterized protein KVR01_011960 [Diaporthe batatas]KAG8158199.1 hypothetical protein KVR01_011960 [Diaporthe batatas]
MAGTSHEGKTSERIKAFSAMVKDSKATTDTAQALAAHVEKEEQEQINVTREREKWRRWWQQSLCAEFETKDDDSLLRQCQEVTGVWKEFCKNSVIKRALHKTDISLVDEFHPPTIDTLQRVVQHLGSARTDRSQEGWGKFKANALAFAESLNGHKALFSIFPSENIYTSLLSGIVSTIVLACANHKRVGEAFTRGLKSIGDNLAFLSRSKNTLNTPLLRKAICDAYVEVFKFLCYMMRWQTSRWNRLSSSVQSSFYDDHIKAHIDEIEQLAKKVNREINRETLDGVRDLLEIGNNLTPSEKSKTAADRSRRQDASDRTPIFDRASKAFSQLGYNVTYCLTATEEQHDHDILMLAIRRNAHPEVPVPQSQERLVARSLEAQTSTATSDLSSGEEERHSESYNALKHYARAEIEGFTVSIEPYVNNGVKEAIEFSQDSGTSLPSEVVSDIQEWLQGDKSAFLWVEGPVSPCDLSPTAIRVLAVLDKVGIPCISFFDQEKYHNPHRLDFKESGVICLLYALINQSILQMESVIETAETLDDAYFARLDGSWASTAPALDTLRLLLSFAPPSMVIVIHGLDAVDGRATRKVLTQLIDIIREQSSRTVVKSLFTTNGMSQSLGGGISRRERVDASRMVQDRPRRSLPGAGSLSDLGIPSSGDAPC